MKSLMTTYLYFGSSRYLHLATKSAAILQNMLTVGRSQMLKSITAPNGIEELTKYNRRTLEVSNVVSVLFFFFVQLSNSYC